MNNLWQRVHNKLSREYYLDLGGGPEATILVAATPRSGSTWMEELINYRNDFRVIFEPFHAQEIEELKDRSMRIYMKKGTSEKDFSPYIEKTLEGRISSFWTDQFNHKIIARRRLIKCVRTAFMIGWIKEKYPALKTIVHFRHPAPVALSKIKLGWPSDIEWLIKDERIVEDYIHPFLDLIRDDLPPFEKFITFWCLEYYVMLKSLNMGGVHCSFYEELVLQPSKNATSLMRYCNVPINNNFKKALKKPSQMARKDHGKAEGRKRLELWKREVSEDQMKSMMRILDRFELSSIYTDKIEPNIEGIKAFQSNNLR